MKAIGSWRKATEEVAKTFLKKYFKHHIYNEDTFWVSDEVGSIFCIGDWYFDIKHMIEALELEATFEQLDEYYEMEIEYGLENRPLPINFKNFIKYGGQLLCKQEKPL